MSEHAVHLQPFAGYLLRVFAPGKKFGQPYEIIVPIRRKDANTAYFEGLAANILPYRQVIVRKLRQLGYTRMEWDRHNQDGTHRRKVSIDITPRTTSETPRS